MDKQNKENNDEENIINNDSSLNQKHNLTEIPNNNENNIKPENLTEVQITNSSISKGIKNKKIN